jgi:hypothetical protein
MADSWEDLINEWCPKQGNSSIVRVVEILEAHPNLTGSGVLIQVWEDVFPDSRGENEDEESVRQFYQTLPVLPVFRPLLACPDCGMPTPSVNCLIRELAEHHMLTAKRVAKHLRQIFAKEFQGVPDGR